MSGSAGMVKRAPGRNRVSDHTRAAEPRERIAGQPAGGQTDPPTDPDDIGVGNPPNDGGGKANPNPDPMDIGVG